jgi:AcrR family transcriptional regulator
VLLYLGIETFERVKKLQDKIEKVDKDNKVDITDIANIIDKTEKVDEAKKLDKENNVDKKDDPLNVFLQQYLKTEENLTDKQKSVLKAAVEVFSEKGFAAASTSEIAQRAGVAEGTVFKHYKTKKGLLLRILSPTIIKLGAPLLIKDFEKILEAKYQNFGDFLQALIEDRIEYAKKNAGAVKILFHEISYHAELREMLKEIFVQRIFPRLQKAIRYFQKKGELAELPDDTIIRLVISTVLGYITTRILMLPEKDWNDEKEIENMVVFLLKGLKPDGK